jgi:hypothetical protein
MKTRLNGMIGLTLLLAAFIGVSSAAAQAGLTFIITEVDAEGFPQVSFNLRAIELGNNVISSLNESNVTVYENGEQVSGLEITQNQDGPITYIFVIDQGRLSNFTSFGLANIRQVISTLVSGGYFVDGRDTVMVLGRQHINSDQTVVLLPATQTATDLTTWVANFNFARGSRNTMGLLGVEDAVQQMSELVPIPGSETTAIIYVTRYIEDPSSTVAPTSAQNTAAEARNNNTSVYVFHTDLGGLRKDALQVLADGSGGQYAHLDRSGFLSAATAVYQTIDTQRTYYTVDYRSPVSEGEQREITINTPGRPSEGVIGTYEVALLPPSVSISEPIANSVIRREATLGEEEGAVPTFDTARLRVVAEVTWPDERPRHLRSAALTINGITEDSIDLEPDQTQLQFEWDPSDIVTEGVNLVTLGVSVEDELGMVATAESQVSVEVIFPAEPEAKGFQLTPLIAALSVPVLCFIVALVVTVGGGGFYLLRVRGTKTGPAGAQDQPEVLATVFVDDNPELVFATLTLLEGPSGLIGEVFKMSSLKTTIGRNPGVTDISFYADEESSLSRVHCSITLEDDNTFQLTDMVSSAGTRLNGRKIQAETPVILADGDEIVLGNLAGRGVKLRFNLATADDLGPYSGTADDRTHFVGDQEG